MKLFNLKTLAGLSIGILLTHCGGNSDVLKGKTYKVDNPNEISQNCVSAPSEISPNVDSETVNTTSSGSTVNSVNYAGAPSMKKIVDQNSPSESEASYEIIFSEKTFTVVQDGTTVSTGTWSRVDQDTLSITADNETFTVDYSISGDKFIIGNLSCSSSGATTSTSSSSSGTHNYYDSNTTGENQDWDLDLTPDRYDADPYNPNVQ
ncbi:MAG: hypothetical protein HYU97_07445 [Deltaproteobacteria bacterium]|nr:hypothetical protein [Deltaproteobacteria bacterium]